MNRINNIGTGKFNDSLDASTRKANTLANSLKNVGSATKRSASMADKFTRGLNKGLGAFNEVGHSVLSTLGKIASAYLGIMGTRATLGASDKITSAENKFNYMNGGNEALTQTTLDKIYNSAQKARTGYTEMATNVGKSMVIAGEAFGNNVDNAIRFQEIMGKAYVVGGASAQEQASSMYQLVQALGSGTLAGDELRSVREGAPLAAKAIEKYAQKIHNTSDSLKQMGADGKITADMVVKAMLDAGGSIDEAFGDTKTTFAQFWTNFKSMFKKAFEPFLQSLNKIVPTLEKIRSKAEPLIFGLGNAFSGIADWVNEKLEWVANNMDKVKNAILSVVGALATLIPFFIIAWIVANPWKAGIMLAFVALVDLIYEAQNAGYTMGQAIGEAFRWVAMWLAIIGGVALAVGIAFGFLKLQVMGIGLLVLATLALMIGVFLAAEDAVTGLSNALLVLSAIVIILGIIFHSTVLVIIGLIALVAAIFVLYAEEIIGVIYAAGATIWNIIAGLVNGIVQFLWTRFVEPFIGIIEWILNVCNGGFDSFGGAVANLIGQVISWFLSLGKVVTKIIDAIFGTNWTAGLTSLQDDVLAWGKNEKAITLDRTAPEIMQRIDVTDAYDSGAAVGKGIQDGINSGLGGLQKGINLDGLMGSDKGLLDKISNATLNQTEIPVSDAETEANTGKMAKSMETTAEDLKYLRQIAEMEAINKFTTAEIKIDMTNNNNVSGTSDLDGIVTYFTEKLREELAIVASGAHL